MGDRFGTTQRYPPPPSHGLDFERSFARRGTQQQPARNPCEPVSGQAVLRVTKSQHRKPVFDHELSYPDIRSRDAGFQLLALYRYWNTIEYWFPYRDVLAEDWDRVLTEFIPKIALAKSFEESQRELMALIAHAHDTHSNL